MAVIVTDGLIDDHVDVNIHITQYAEEVYAGRQKFIKLVLIGLGEHVDVGQLEELDNFDAAIDIWSVKLTSEMNVLHEVLDEVMSEECLVASSGKIFDNKGLVLMDYNDGLPA